MAAGPLILDHGQKNHSQPQRGESRTLLRRNLLHYTTVVYTEFILVA